LLEEAVLKWYSQQLSSGVGVRGVELKAAAAAAEKFAKHLKLHNFTCSSGCCGDLDKGTISLIEKLVVNP
jgi:hypothetical protein